MKRSIHNDRLNTCHIVPDFGLTERSELPIFLIGEREEEGKGDGEREGAVVLESRVSLDIEVSTAEL